MLLLIFSLDPPIFRMRQVL
uniref:Uncharacterized protein n=1 Tax=Lepeophtheirus salmonis TaxID=72036 RepID=A0A0K2TWF0_LEPSM